MAAPPVVEVNKQLWDDALTRLLDLSTVTVKRNAELETRVAELEVELAVWKQAHSVVVEAAEREKKAHNAQVATFNRQLSSTDHLKVRQSILQPAAFRDIRAQNQSPLILCVVDGDANVFSSTLIAKGQQGGREAAQELTKGIAEHLSQEGVQAFGRLSFWVTVYYNKRSLLSMLQSEGVCSAEQFEAFMSGLSQASLRFLLVDVGPGKDGAEAKILEYLQTYVYLPQTLRIFLAGERTAAYLSTLTAIYKKELLGKVVVLQGRERLSGDFDHLPMHCLSIEGLFEPRLSAYVQKRPGPIPFTDVNRNVTTHGGLISPQSESQSTTPSSSTQTRYTNNGTQPIDPTKV
ncbi:uncharacterized protein FIBRA_07040 [Fibroporia radiculosa]|uniref:DUF7923 domain-containing protein n=1 Tax=Fibroporia radiculosa TaxID=599839 RepID=J4I022_9APHY|nr:uncharacterized protein FIBRA_07040 [Fibroporia radiculosa]CCM04847.1 predicted protein [Fibroporia radiculosa]